MLLSRTAANLYWMARYMERAESLARILQAARRLSITSRIGLSSRNEWASVITIAGYDATFYEDGREAVPLDVCRYLIVDDENEASIISCLKRARENARSVRGSLTTDMWESLNATWLAARDHIGDAGTASNPGEFLEWVKERTLQFRGALIDTMSYSEARIFSQIGTNLERANNTARLLDVKYHVLLPEQEQVGGAVDYYQWTAVLRAVSAHRSYHFIYGAEMTAWHTAEFLVLSREMPRSLYNSLRQLNDNLERLAGLHGERHECHRLADELFSQLRYGRIDTIFERGLHEFLTEFINRNGVLSDEIVSSYLC